MKRLLILLIVSYIFFTPTASQSELVQLSFTGTIENVNYWDSRSAIFDKYLNTSFNGVFGIDYDPNISPIDVDAYLMPAMYHVDLSDFYVESSQYPLFGELFIEIINDPGINQLINRFDQTETTLPSPYNWTDGIHFFFTASSGNAYSDSTSPTGLPTDVNWSMFDGGFFSVEFYPFNNETNYSDNIDLSGHFESVHPVPIPSTILLLGTGLLGIATLKRKTL